MQEVHLVPYNSLAFGWTVQSEAFFVCVPTYSLFWPQTFTVITFYLKIMTLNIADLFTAGDILKSCHVVKIWKEKKKTGTCLSSWTQKCYKGCVGFNPFLLVTWMFPQVLLNGVNPLNALNQFNSKVFAVFHLLFPRGFLFWSDEQTLNPPPPPHMVENVPSSSQTVSASL